MNDASHSNEDNDQPHKDPLPSNIPAPQKLTVDQIKAKYDSSLDRRFIIGESEGN